MKSNHYTAGSARPRWHRATGCGRRLEIQFLGRRIGPLAGILAVFLQAARADVRLSGRVVDENNAAVPGAQVVLQEGATAAEPGRWQAVSDEAGSFSLTVARSGNYLLKAEREGFFRFESRPMLLQEGPNELTVVMNPAREVFERVDVSYSPPAIDFDKITSEKRLTSTELLAIPYPTTNNLRNVMRVIPGVVQDSKGGLHLNGGAEEQVLYTLDGFQLNDPLTGRFESRMGVEAVRSVEISTSNLPAEFGKGSAGALALKTTAGDDRIRYAATNFFPGFENRKGLIIGGFTPRASISGPIRRGRAWFSDTADLQYDKRVVEELPKGRDRTTSWRWSNLLRNQINLTPSNILYAGFLANYWTAPRAGLGVLDPPETTLDRRTRQWFFDLKDQVYFTGGTLLEIGAAVNRTFGREVPQGQLVYQLTPEGRRGNFFSDATRKAGRNEALANLFLPSFGALGSHHLKLGVDFDTLSYWQDVRRTGYENFRVDGSLVRHVSFGGNGRLDRSNLEMASYIQDSWKPRPGLLLEVGLRQDWDRLVGNNNIAPRLGIAWTPPGTESTKLSGGIAFIYDQSNLRLFTRPLDQYSLTTYFDPAGRLVRGPAVSIFTIGGAPLKSPLYRNWNLGLEHRFPRSVYSRVAYLRRRGVDGFTYSSVLADGLPAPQAILARFPGLSFDSVYDLRNFRTDLYDSVELTVRQAFLNQYEWLASYTRSRAFSNAVVDLNVDDPVIVSKNVGRMPWDAPNRFLSWGYLPTPWPNWALAYLFETRNGFPFSVQDDDGRIHGDLNSYRFPAFFELNLHAERKFIFRKNRWAFRFGFNNITNHKNSNVVNNNASSPQFLTYYGGQSRSLNFRIRWLGKQ